MAGTTKLKDDALIVGLPIAATTEVFPGVGGNTKGQLTAIGPAG